MLKENTKTFDIEEHLINFAVQIIRYSTFAF
jgi:hypothetical protein